MKNFVLDTNVILHDYQSIYNFEDNNIFLPIVVLEELDHFKKGSEQINFNAREFIRELDKLTTNDLFQNGASLGEERGRMFIVLGNQYHEDITKVFPEKIPDHRILSITKSVIDKHPNEKTILVTKDVNLRMKAKAVGIETEDYYSDKVKDVDVFNTEQKIIEIANGDIINKLYKEDSRITPQDIDLKEDLQPNECFTVSDGNSSILIRYDKDSNLFKKIEKKENMGIKPRNAEQTFSFELLNDPNINLIALTGNAGTGKTLLALAAALNQSNKYHHIFLMRPIISLSNKDIGFLPGNEKEKIAPYMQPLFDNLNVIKYQAGASQSKVIEDLQNDGRLSIESLAFIRGRSLSDTFCIIDEAQNLTPHEIKTIITRAGEGTKMVFTGDIHQIDSPYLDAQSNGLVYMIDKMKGQSFFGHVNLIKGERSELAEIASKLL